MKAEFIQETITEESYTEESVVLDNMEVEKPAEDITMDTNNDVQESGSCEAGAEVKDKTKDAASDMPKITLQENCDSESDLADTVPEVIAKDIKEIEHDAEKDVHETSVKDLVMKKGGKDTDTDKFESVGSQCDIEDTDKTGIRKDELINNVKAKDDTNKVDVEKVDKAVKAKKKFDVTVAVQDSKGKELMVLEKPPLKKEKLEKKDIDASSHDEVMFEDVFSEKVSDDEQSKTITSTSDLLVEVSDDQLTHNLLNGIIHLPFLELSIVIFRDIKMRT